jgi:hypothetical protein
LASRKLRKDMLLAQAGMWKGKTALHRKGDK